MPPFYITSSAIDTHCVLKDKLWNISNEQISNKLRMVFFRPEEPFSGQHNANNQHTDNDQLNFESPVVLPNNVRE